MVKPDPQNDPNIYLHPDGSYREYPPEAETGGEQPLETDTVTPAGDDADTTDSATSATGADAGNSPETGEVVSGETPDQATQQPAE